MKRATSWLAGIVAIGCILSCAGFNLPVQLLFYTITGWAFFLARVLPDVKINWPDTCLAVVALATFCVGVHWFAAWLYRETERDTAPHSDLNTSRQTSPPLRVWRPQWTISIVAVVIAMFVAGISMVGMTHNIVWMLTESGPLIEGGGRESARGAQSRNNLKQIGLGVFEHEDVRKSLPAGCKVDAFGRPLHGWQTQLLPWLEGVSLYSRVDLAKPWDDPIQGDVFKTRMRLFENPGFQREDQVVNSLGYALSHYASNSLVLGGDRARNRSEIKDGEANTILAGEVANGFRPWGHPINWRDPRRGLDKSPDGFGSLWRGGVQFLMVDGSVHIVSRDVDPSVLEAMSTPAGGEHFDWP